MQLGVFIPIGNNGWLISKSAPQYMPTFELNKEIVQAAEAAGFDFALSMIKLRGFGGDTEFWDHNLESFTLMAGLAAVTDRIKLFASTAILTLHPAIAARMASTIDSIAPGRFGINIVTGWAEAEYSQMGLWPGESHFSNRYRRATEYVQTMKDLWGKGECTLPGEFYQLDDCKLSPRPVDGVELVAAGRSSGGMKFAAENVDYNFITAVGVNTPTAVAPTVEILVAAREEAGSDVGALLLFMIITDTSDEKAHARWNDYQQNADLGALQWLVDQADQDTAADASSTARTMGLPEGAINFNMGTLVGSYERIAEMLDEAAGIPGTKGVMLVFDDFVGGIRDFKDRIEPLMTSRP